VVVGGAVVVVVGAGLAVVVVVGAGLPVVVVVGAGLPVVVVVWAGAFVEVPDDEVVVTGGAGRCVVDVVGAVGDLEVVGVEKVVVTFVLLRCLPKVPFERSTFVVVAVFFDDVVLVEATAAWDDAVSD
jgi:hypothetical protein